MERFKKLKEEVSKLKFINTTDYRLTILRQYDYENLYAMYCFLLRFYPVRLFNKNLDYRLDELMKQFDYEGSYHLCDDIIGSIISYKDEFDEWLIKYNRQRKIKIILESN